MNTLLIGVDNEYRQILLGALELRRHEVDLIEPTDLDPERIGERSASLIIFSHVDEQIVGMVRRIVAADAADRLTLVSVLSPESIDQFNDLLDAGIDQCIVESIYDEQRLDIRLAFAEKLARDKTQRSIIEQKLRESEARYRSIVETTVDAIITINDKGLIRTFNKAAEKLFNYNESEVIGKNVHILMPEPYKSEHDDYIDNYLTTGKKKIIGLGREVTGRRKNGETFPMYLAVSEAKIRGNRIFTGIVRDISEQRRLELEILRTSEHERRRIGQDLHDGLGQMLTGIGLISRSVAKNLAKEEHPLADQAEEITSQIKEADQYARELARGLVPVEFESEGLVAALDRLTSHAEKLFRITCSFSSNGTIELEDSTHVTHLYRIAQEAVSNAVKHGDADEVRIQLVSSEDRIRLRIDDNGTGFTEEWDEKGGLGVRIMQFRASLIGANLEISDSGMGGARVTCTIPIIG